MTENLLRELADQMSQLGFLREGKRKHDTDAWVRVAGEVIRHEVYLSTPKSTPDEFGCAIRLTYHARARDRWNENGPFLFEIWGYDLLPSGLRPAGTPGSVCWARDQIATFMRTFSTVAVPQFEAVTDLRSLRAAAAATAQQNPRDALMLMALGFIDLDLGDPSAARDHFDRYLARAPAMKSSMGPLIDRLFIGG